MKLVVVLAALAVALAGAQPSLNMLTVSSVCNRVWLVENTSPSTSVTFWWDWAPTARPRFSATLRGDHSMHVVVAGHAASRSVLYVYESSSSTLSFDEWVRQTTHARQGVAFANAPTNGAHGPPASCVTVTPLCRGQYKIESHVDRDLEFAFATPIYSAIKPTWAETSKAHMLHAQRSALIATAGHHNSEKLYVFLSFGGVDGTLLRREAVVTANPTHDCDARAHVPMLQLDADEQPGYLTDSTGLHTLTMSTSSVFSSQLAPASFGAAGSRTSYLGSMCMAGSSYIELDGPMNDASTTFTNGLTLSTWVYLDSWTNGDRAELINKQAPLPLAAENEGFALYVGSNGGSGAQVAGCHAGVTLESATGVLTTGAWHHVACSFNYDNFQTTLYVDGSMVEQANIDAADDRELVQAGAYTLTVGAREDGTNVLPGCVDEVMVHAWWLSAAGIERIAVRRWAIAYQRVEDIPHLYELYPDASGACDRASGCELRQPDNLAA